MFDLVGNRTNSAVRTLLLMASAAMLFTTGVAKAFTEFDPDSTWTAL